MGAEDKWLVFELLSKFMLPKFYVTYGIYTEFWPIDFSDTPQLRGSANVFRGFSSTLADIIELYIDPGLTLTGLPKDTF